MCVEQIRTLSEKEKDEKESLDVLNGRRCWLERVDSATESHFVGQICPSHLQDASDHVCSVFISTFFFSDNLIIYETPNLIKFYTCLVWELTFYS